MSEIEEQQVEYSWDITYNVVMGETYATFMENQRQKKIVGNVGPSGVHYPPKPFCDISFEACKDWVELDGIATLLTYTVVHVPMPHLPPPPSITGIFKMGESVVNFVHHIGGIDTSDPAKVEDKIKIGMKFKPVWKEERKGHMFDIDYFEPAE
ncbi:MAG: OB-fold domain-containing protein [Pseudomonadales bacterium]|nr:OB-fold domain-containing protein [Pseudomonadales bacterium]